MDSICFLGVLKSSSDFRLGTSDQVGGEASGSFPTSEVQAQEGCWAGETICTYVYCMSHRARSFYKTDVWQWQSLISISFFHISVSFCVPRWSIFRFLEDRLPRLHQCTILRRRNSLQRTESDRPWLSMAFQSGKMSQFSSVFSKLKLCPFDIQDQKDWKIPPCISNWKNAKVGCSI